MAKRRMIGISVFESDRFLDLPIGARALYPNIMLRADDNGLLNNMKALIRTIDAIDEDLELLIESGFIINMGEGVFAVTHWEQQNHVPKSKYTPTVFVEELARLELLDNDSYRLR